MSRGRRRGRRNVGRVAYRGRRGGRRGLGCVIGRGSGRGLRNEGPTPTGRTLDRIGGGGRGTATGALRMRARRSDETRRDRGSGCGGGGGRSSSIPCRSRFEWRPGGPSATAHGGAGRRARPGRRARSRGGDRLRLLCRIRGDHRGARTTAGSARGGGRIRDGGGLEGLHRFDDVGRQPGGRTRASGAAGDRTRSGTRIRSGVRAVHAAIGSVPRRRR